MNSATKEKSKAYFKSSNCAWLSCSMKLPTENIDEKFMRLAIAEAIDAAREGNAPIGSVITRNGRVVARVTTRFSPNMTLPRTQRL